VSWSRIETGRIAGLLLVGAQGNAIVSSTNWHTPEYGPVAEDETVTKELLHALLRKGPSRVSLRFIDTGRIDLAARREVGGSRGYRTNWRIIQRSRYLNVAARWEDFERG
jgi:hypothetical protein